MDIDSDAQPDIVGSVLDMSMVPTQSVDAVFTSHMLEHLYAHEIPVALAEIRRVLKQDALALITVPDLQSVAHLITEDRLCETVYVSPAGPITPFDMVYGHRGFVGQGRLYMAHRSGFTLTTLVEAFKTAGFGSVIGLRREAGFDLWVLAIPQVIDEDLLRELAMQYFPSWVRSHETTLGAVLVTPRTDGDGRH
ncbi:MAG: class I SAM-dependent methyltransferase [Pseudomonadota bacterium]